MLKRLSIIASILLIVFLGWVILGTDITNSVQITINGQEITSAFAKALGGGIGLIITTIVLLCVGMLLLFVFTGVGLLLITIFAIVGSILFAVAFPFLLPILVPLILLFVFLSTKRKRSTKSNAPFQNP